MKVTYLAGIAVVAGGIIAVNLASAPSAGAVPVGAISNQVQNRTAQGILKESDAKRDAVRVKAGDILRYVVEVRNTAEIGADSDMYAAKLTGTLPGGLEFVSDPQKRTINEDLGVISAPGRVVKEYPVKVTSTKDGAMLEFKACFSGDSAARDNPVKGCNLAYVRVDKTRPDAPAAPLTSPLPSTGASEWFAPVTAFTAGAAAYVARLKSFRHRDSELAD